MQGNYLKAKLLMIHPSKFSLNFYVHRDQPGDGSEPGGYSQHIAVPPDA